MMGKIKQASRVAFKDITEYLNENGRESLFDEVWYVTPNEMNSKETRALNRELGIHKINKYGNTNGNRRSKKTKQDS